MNKALREAFYNFPFVTSEGRMDQDKDTPQELLNWIDEHFLSKEEVKAALDGNLDRYSGIPTLFEIRNIFREELKKKLGLEGNK